MYLESIYLGPLHGRPPAPPPVLRHIPQLRGVMTTMTERSPASPLDAGDREEIAILLQALHDEDMCAEFPFASDLS